ncbi:MAG: AbrB/MazE/SpoVT family DNA-binding domain-containing protein [Formosimonas sp.]
MKTTFRKMGNSTGIIIPKAFLLELGFESDEVEMTLENHSIVLRKPAPQARVGWAQASAQLAAAGEDALQWPQFNNRAREDVTW